MGWFPDFRDHFAGVDRENALTPFRQNLPKFRPVRHVVGIERWARQGRHMKSW